MAPIIFVSNCCKNWMGHFCCTWTKNIKRAHSHSVVKKSCKWLNSAFKIEGLLMCCKVLDLLTAAVQ